MSQFLTLFAQAASSCKPSGGGFFGFPTWYKYLGGNLDYVSNTCSPKVTGLSDIWLIVAAVIEILLRAATIAAIGLVLYGGALLVVGQGEPDKVAKARSTILNALIGLVITLVATGLVTYIAGRF